jgi:hypothetical protein
MSMAGEDYFLNPPPGSAAARAVEFGIDLTLTLENLRLTPEERIRQLDNHVAGIAKMKATTTCLGRTAALHGKPEQGKKRNLSYNPHVSQPHKNLTEKKSTTGVDAIIEAYKKDVDRTLIRRNLRLSVDERFQQLMQLQRFAEELRSAGKQAKSRQ